MSSFTLVAIVSKYRGYALSVLLYGQLSSSELMQLFSRYSWSRELTYAEVWVRLVSLERAQARVRML